MGNQQRAVEAHTRYLRALELRKAGMSYAEIAQQVGFSSPQVAWTAVKRALRLTVKEPAEEVRAIEIERLDAVLAAIWPQVKDGDHSAIDRYIKIAQRRAELLGLDAPKRADLTSAGQPITWIIERDDNEEDKALPSAA